MTKLEHALALAAKGFKVFPIAPGQKAPPLLHGWPQRASSDPDVVRDFWIAVPDANIGISCEGMIVVDVDVKKGGDESFQKLEMIDGFPVTFTTRTPTGGRHVYYRSAVAVPNSVGALGAGLDMRSAGGYVVAPGSEVEAGRYVVEQDITVAEAPAWLVTRCGTVTPKVDNTERKVDNATEEVVERAREWLAGQLPAFEGQGGDARTFKVVCGLRDMGVSAEQALELLAAWNATCAPPWALEELAVKVSNAYRYAQNEPGARAALPDDFPVVPESGTEQPKKGIQAAAYRLSEFANSQQKGPGYLVKGLLQRRTYAELFGAPGEGKTFVALDIAYCVAAGKPWMGRKSHGGTVLYLAYEGIGGLVKRAQALRKKYGDADVPLYVASAAYNLREPSGRATLGLLLATLPEKPVLVVIDTFARALMGGDENSAQDVGAFNSAVAALIENTGACTLIVHHSGKNKSAGARGSSALLGAIDTELEVDGGQLIARKQRDVETGEPIGFRLVPVLVGVDEDGDEVTSCVVEPATVIADRATGRLTGNPKRGFDVLCEIAPNNAPVSELKWREACAGFLPKRQASFWDMRKTLVQRGFVIADETGMVTRRME